MCQRNHYFELLGRCLDGAIRLVEGSFDFEGRVEICINGVWGTVCNNPLELAS